MENVVVIGANRGIGLALSQLHHRRGDQVVAACRQRSGPLEHVSARLIEGIEVTDPVSVAVLVEQLAGTRIDRLLVNAGVLLREDLPNLGEAEFAAIRYQFEVNTIAPLRLVHALLHLLQSGSRIGLLSSRMGSMEDNTSGGYYGYRASKAALNAMGRSLAIDLQPRGISVALLHPGFVRTGMTSGQGDLEPEQAAAGLIEQMDGLNLANSGNFVHSNGSSLPW